MDAQGEELRDGGDHFEARVQQIPEGVSIHVEQTDMSNGLYSVSFVLNDPGMNLTFFSAGATFLMLECGVQADTRYPCC